MCVCVSLAYYYAIRFSMKLGHLSIRHRKSESQKHTGHRKRRTSKIYVFLSLVFFKNVFHFFLLLFSSSFGLFFRATIQSQQKNNQMLHNRTLSFGLHHIHRHERLIYDFDMHGYCKIPLAKAPPPLSLPSPKRYDFELSRCKCRCNFGMKQTKIFIWL